MIRHGGHGKSGASIETTLELWASSLREVKRRMRPLFTQARVARSAENFLEGLLGEERRKTGWMRAEAAGDPGPWRQQAILGRGQWDADALRDIVRDYALETLANDDAVLVVDETGFLKQGKAACGVARQYTGSAGKITNCQIGVFACYVAPRGHAFIDRELYLPKSWTDDPARMAKAHVPQEIIDSASGGFAAGLFRIRCLNSLVARIATLDSIRVRRAARRADLWSRFGGAEAGGDRHLLSTPRELQSGPQSKKDRTEGVTPGLSPVDRGRVETCFFDLPIAAADRQEKRWRACSADEFSRRWPA